MWLLRKLRQKIFGRRQEPEVEKKERTSLSDVGAGNRLGKEAKNSLLLDIPPKVRLLVTQDTNVEEVAPGPMVQEEIPYLCTSVSAHTDSGQEESSPSSNEAEEFEPDTTIQDIVCDSSVQKLVRDDASVHELATEETNHLCTYESTASDMNTRLEVACQTHNEVSLTFDVPSGGPIELTVTPTTTVEDIIWTLCASVSLRYSPEFYTLYQGYDEMSPDDVMWDVIQMNGDPQDRETFTMKVTPLPVRVSLEKDEDSKLMFSVDFSQPARELHELLCFFYRVESPEEYVLLYERAGDVQLDLTVCLFDQAVLKYEYIVLTKNPAMLVRPNMTRGWYSEDELTYTGPSRGAGAIWTYGRYY